MEHERWSRRVLRIVIVLSTIGVAWCVFWLSIAAVTMFAAIMLGDWKSAAISGMAALTDWVMAVLIVRERSRLSDLLFLRHGI